jgi:hypothetical protein
MYGTAPLSFAVFQAASPYPFQFKVQLSLGSDNCLFPQFPQLVEIVRQLDAIQLQLPGVFGVQLMILFNFTSQILAGIANEVAMVHRFDGGFEHERDKMKVA